MKTVIAQERSLFPLVLAQVQAKQVWVADRNFCTNDFLTQIAQREAYFGIREHQKLAWTAVTALVAVGSNASGALFEQQVGLSRGLVVRRVIQLKETTRHGDAEVAVLSNRPMTEVDALMIAVSL